MTSELWEHQTGVELAYGDKGVGFDTPQGEASDRDGKVVELRAYLDAASDADVLDALVTTRERQARACPAPIPTAKAGDANAN